MEFFTLASGSGGNALLLRDGGTHLLIDAGISAKRIGAALASLGMAAGDLDAILITHEHSDHIGGLKTLVKHYAVPIYASEGTCRAIAQQIPAAAGVLRPFSIGAVLSFGGCSVQTFETSHDAAQSCGYRVDGALGSFGILTDTGFVTPAARAALAGVDALVLEANHDPDMLRSGPYPYYLKARIAGDQGHLSNEAAARFAAEMAHSGTRTVLLAHLSEENNTPQRAEYAVGRALQSEGLPVRLGIAPRSEMSEGFLCRKSPSFA